MTSSSSHSNAADLERPRKSNNTWSPVYKKRGKVKKMHHPTSFYLEENEEPSGMHGNVVPVADWLLFRWRLFQKDHVGDLSKQNSIEIGIKPG